MRKYDTQILKVLSQTVSFCPFNEKVLVYVFLEKVALLTSTHFMVVGLVL